VGGEILLATLSGFERLGHLAPVAMPGGTAAIKEPWRMAAAYLDLAYDGSPPGTWPWPGATRTGGTWSCPWPAAGPPVHDVQRRTPLRRRLRPGLRPRRCQLRGQAAIELEQLARADEDGAYTVPISSSVPFQLHAKALVRAVVEDLAAGTSGDVVAARFHNGLAKGVVEACRRAREMSGGISTVALGGGVFQNVLLTERTAAGLEDDGFRAWCHTRSPPMTAGSASTGSSGRCSRHRH